MPGYELTLLFNPALGEERINGLLEKVEEKIKGFGGDIAKTDKWGVKKLPSVIRKVRSLQQAYYVLISFSAETGVPAKVLGYLKVTENILRYAINKEVIQPPPPRRYGEGSSEVQAVNVSELKDVSAGGAGGQP